MSRHRSYWILIIWCLWGVQAGWAQTPDSIHHRLSVTLEPDSHTIQGRDEITLSPPRSDASSQSFLLNPHLKIQSIQVNQQIVPSDRLSIEPTDNAQKVTVHTGPRKWVKIAVAYEGIIDDTPKASKGLRFVRPDTTTGHIGNNGVYLTYETLWFPTFEASLFTFDVTVNTPDSYQAITQGEETSQKTEDARRVSSWRGEYPTEGLTLAANQFIVKRRTWRSIQLMTYLFPAEAHLAEEYLDATQKYLEVYTNLLGPYPFKKFAVVENFFPSGIGLPSFTLLGQGVVRRGYTQPYSLGHEIVHSWLGNSVLNDLSRGNWVEGLTTYLSNYYFDEISGNLPGALKTRRRMLDEYNLYATQEKDYPIRSFHHKETRLDNAIGYQKTALVFHMLRKEMGDENFFAGVRALIQQGTGKFMAWENLQQVFSAAGGRNLQEFFHQWIDRPGAPSIRLSDRNIAGSPTDPGNLILTGNIQQSSPPFSMQLPARIFLKDGTTQDFTLSLKDSTQPLTVKRSQPFNKIVLDPNYDVLLRLNRSQISPMLNAWETDSKRILLLPKTFATKEDEEAFSAPLQRLKRQPNVQILQTDTPTLSESASYLIFGLPAKQLLESGALPVCQAQVQLTKDQMIIQSQSFKGQHMAFLISCPHPTVPGHVATLFFGFSPQAIKPMARLLFFYGWDSYLVFERGKVIARGRFAPVHSARTISLAP